jgi:hypothetical protein
MLPTATANNTIHTTVYQKQNSNTSTAANTTNSHDERGHRLPVNPVTYKSNDSNTYNKITRHMNKTFRHIKINTKLTTLGQRKTFRNRYQ